MGRPRSEWGEPLRQYWQQINRYERQALAGQRAKRKANDKKRRKCRCKAYPFPHRPGGGLCRWPDPPLTQWQAKPGGRPYRQRYAGLFRQIARANGLHPIRDKRLIEELLPQVVAAAKQLKRRYPKWKYKYRNMEIIDHGDGSYAVRGNWTTAGPTM
jgi:hypothetical protein